MTESITNLAHEVALKCNQLGIKINACDYSFLDTQDKFYTPLIVGLGGSWAYGTNIETSDVDIRGVALRKPFDILTGRDFEQVTNEETDTTIYSLDKMIKLLVNCNPNTVEILGLKPEHYLYLHPLGEELIKNADMFLSMRCVKSFMGYANQQLYRLQQKSLVALSEEELNKHIVKTLNNMRDMLETNHDMSGIAVRLENGQIVLDLDVKSYPAESLSAVLGVLNKTLQDYHKNSVRNEKAMAHGKIAKHSMHLMRLYMMVEDILLNHTIKTYRDKEHDFLMDIRNGKYLGEDGRPTKEFFDMVEYQEVAVQFAKEKSDLPAEPDMKRIDKFLVHANRAYL